MSETGQFFFVHCLEFFENWSLDKKDQEHGQKNSPVSETSQFFLADQKNEKLTGQLVYQRD